MDAGSSGYSIGVDIGGTFTDCAVLAPDGRRWTGKTLTVPENLSAGFFGSIDAAGATMGLSLGQLLSQTSRLTHGTTSGINALVTRRGAKVGLLATRGHGDAIRIMDSSGRVTGASLEEMLDYSISSAPRQLLGRSQIHEVTERVDCVGEVVVGLDEREVRAAMRELLAENVEAIAISYLWAHVNPLHELRSREIVQAAAPDLFVTCSHEVAPRTGEYPRTATTVMNAYVGPLISRYVDQLAVEARELGYRDAILFGTCEGGLLDLATIKQVPLLTAQSGPVGGALGCAMLGREMGFENIITTDMGGTSLDASLIEAGDIQLTDETVLERHQIFLRKAKVESIGTGGGSIAWFDEGKQTLRVGPRSAGAVPGPVCYARGGTEPTVTDADLVLGLLDPDRPLAGGLKLDAVAAEQALSQLGAKIGLDAVHCAAGIVRVADSQIEDLLRRITLQQGRDPREFAVWAFGGAAGLHCGLYAKDLGVSEVVLPLSELASVWSAYGIAAAPIARTFTQPLHEPTPLHGERIAAAFAQLAANARAYAELLGLAPDAVRLRRTVEVKYLMQYYSIEVDLGFEALEPADIDGLVDRFEALYERRYGRGTGYRQGGVVVTSARVQLSAPSTYGSAPPSTAAIETAPEGEHMREVYWLETGGFVDTPIYPGTEITPGSVLVGPAVIEYDQTTFAVRPGQHLRADRFGNLVLSLSAIAPSAAALETVRGRA
jgi:N-methylhydantoinase A